MNLLRAPVHRLLVGFWAAACLAAPTFAAPTDGLEAALLAVLTHHPAIHGKRAEVQAREFAGDTARSPHFPTVSVQTQNLPAGNSSVDRTREASTVSALRVRQPLWAFDRIDSSIALADADTQVDRANLLRVRRQLLENTAIAYAKVLGAQSKLTIAQKSTHAHRQLLEQISRREINQISSRADVALASNRLTQASATELRFAGELEMAESDLRALTQEPLAVTPLPVNRYVAPGTVDDLQRIAGDHNADLALKSSQVERSKAVVRQTTAASMPTLYAQADKTYGQARGLDTNRFSFVLEATLDGFGLGWIGRSKSAASQQAAAEQDLVSTRIDVSRTVQRLYSTRKMQESLARSMVESLREFSRLSESYKRQYEAGTKSWLDVLNIEREFYDQQFQQSQAENDGMIATLQLMALTGGFERVLGIPHDYS
mgnify:CR=1 FL=1